MIKIAFFDIDGTILDIGAPSVTPRVTWALNELRRRGVRTFVATGRAPFMLPKFDGIQFDGVMSFNGSFCADKNEVIFANTLDPSDVKRFIENASALGVPVLIATDRRKGSNFFSNDLEEYLQLSLNTANIVSPEEYHKLEDSDVYQLMVGTKEDLDEALLAGTRNLRFARWWPYAADVIPKLSGKALGMEKILDHYGFSREECIAFGDGGNDLDMIRYAGCGVAMDNAVPEVREAADYVTDCCADDGVYTALKHFGLV